MTYSHVRYAATGLVKEMRDDVRIVYGPSVNPSESRARHTLAATFLVTFAVLFAAALPAQAQTTIWSATLTPRTTFSGDPVPLGCDNTSTGNRRCSDSNTLSDDFTDDGTTYAVTKFFTRDGVLTFRLDMSATAATQGLTLVIDGEEFVLKEADQINGGKTQWKWNNTTLGWTAGTDVAVSLVATDAPATGQPTISGGGQVGKTLTAATDDIEDPDGLPTTPTFTYQWVRVDGFTDTDIPGAASETYTLTASDLGKQIKVTVSFTDFRGHAEGPLTSDAYPPNGTVLALPGPCPAVNDWCAAVTAAEDRDAFGYEYDKFGSLTDDQIEYRGQNINVWTVHTQQEASRDYFYFGSLPRVPLGTVVTVGERTFTTDMESEDGSTSDLWQYPPGELPPDLLWSDGQEVRVSLVLGSFPAEGTVWISGTAKRGQTLTAHVSDVSDPDGLTSPSYAYQWVRVDDTTETDIAGATAGTYRLVAADVGKQVKVRRSFTDDRGNAETLTSDAAYPLNGTIEHAPVFGGTHGTRHLAETVGAATVQTAADIGTPVAATDDLANEPLTYSLQGTDADKFTFVSSSGQIRTKVDERYDYETDPSYAVTVRADNVNGAWATIDVTINITNNTNEQPLAPTALTVAATIGSTMSLDVSWTAPDNTGRPAITSYDLRYQKVTATAWTDGPQDVTGTSASIMGLDPGTQYRVAVRATNDDGDGAWSSTSAGDGQRSPDPAVGRTTLPVVRFGSAAYTAIEGVQDATVTVELNPATERSVTILLTATPQGGATASDFSGMPSSVTFAPGETQKTFTVIATDDNVDDDGESVRLGFGRLPSSVEGGSPSTATVVLVQDADVSTWYVWFGESAYTATEGSTARISLHLSAPWKPDLNEALTVPLFTPEHQGGASADDYSGVPSSVTFQRGQTQASFTVRATDDSDDDDGESVLLQFRRLFPDDLEVGRYGPRFATLHIADNDGEKAVTVSFEAANYTAAEGGAAATVRLRLDAAPGRAVTIPLTPSNRGATAADYSGLPTSVTFGASETVQSFTLTATDDSDDDDRESVAIGFGSLPARVSAGSPSETVVQLTDNDHAVTSLQVSFDASAGSVRDGVEEGGGYRLGFSLTTKPGQTLTIPLTYTYLGGATAADFTGLPANVTFGENATSAGVTIRPVDDFEEDPGESLKVSFGALPAGVSVSSLSGRSTIIPVIDNDASPGLSVSDASAREWPNTKVCLIFVVTMDLMDVNHEVSVDYATVSGTAVAGQDFTPISGTLVFRPSESRRRTASKSLCVEVIDDDHDEDTETMTLVLSNPVRAYLADGTATGSISNTDPMPRALMARFGRTTAVEVVEQVEARLEARRERGFEARFAGRPLRSGMERDLGRDFLNRLGTATGAPPQGAKGDPPGFADADTRTARGADPDWRGLLQTSFQRGDVLTGSAFELNQPTRQGGAFSLWGRGAQSRFAGREGVLSLSGRVRTTMLGADYAKGSLVMGLPLFHSSSQGNYSGVDLGEVVSSVTGLYPWVGYKATERVTLWGVTGYGKGTLSLTPGKGATLKSGLSMAMAAAGLRGDLAASVKGGFGLAVKADALWVDTGIEGVEGVEGLSGQLAATAAAVTRFRTALEASRAYDFGRGLSLQPSLEVGLRRDAGDAETGAGVDLGGGLVVKDPLTGLSADVQIRMLLVHQAEGFGERGGSVRLSLDPTPSTPLGFKAQVTPSWGGRATSGAEALWSRETMAGLAAGRSAPGSRFNADFGYGLPVGSRLVGTPRLGIGTSGMARDYRLGYQLTLLHDDAVYFALGVDATRRQSLRQQDEDHRVLGRVTTRW